MTSAIALLMLRCDFTLKNDRFCAKHDGLILSLLVLSDFETLIEANMLTYTLKLLLEYGALIKLRQSEPVKDDNFVLFEKLQMMCFCHYKC